MFVRRHDDLEAFESRYKVDAKPEPYRPPRPAPNLDDDVQVVTASPRTTTTTRRTSKQPGKKNKVSLIYKNPTLHEKLTDKFARNYSPKILLKGHDNFSVKNLSYLISVKEWFMIRSHGGKPTKENVFGTNLTDCDFSFSFEKISLN